jgi:mono/diheme cytochrome c family protein
MYRPLLIVSASLSFASSLLWAQQNKTPVIKRAPPAYQPVPVAEARRPNPVKSTPESIASGQRIFSFDCVQCHGLAGDAKGEVPKDLKLPDLTDAAALKDYTDGAIFYRIKSGHGSMPPEGNRVQTDQLWDLVNYVRSLEAAKAEKAK